MIITKNSSQNLADENLEKDQEVDARIQVDFTSEIGTKFIKNTKSNLENIAQTTIEFHKNRKLQEILGENY